MNMKSLIALSSLALCCAASVRGDTRKWTQQLGTSSSDHGHGISADRLGNVYITGVTYGHLAGTNAGCTDAFLAKYDASGALEWTQQLGTSDYDEGWDVSADGWGNVYISGATRGSLGGPNVGYSDYEDAFLSKYNASGTLQWTRQLGTSDWDGSWGVSADGMGNMYITGRTRGSLVGTSAGGSDVFISKYDASGTLQWTRQLGTSSDDWSYGASADGLGSVYISGYTEGSLEETNAGGRDVFVSKYNASGTLQWTRQFGTGESDESWGVSADGVGNVYIAGWTRGSLDGPPVGGSPLYSDAFISKYDASGALQWTQQLGTSNDDYSYGVSADGLGNVYISGSTWGSLGGLNAGGIDAFLAKYSDLPEPPELRADFTGDGTCDADDFLLWQANFGLADPWGRPAHEYGDADLDGDIDGDDFLAWQGEFEGRGTVSASSANVPEPGSQLLVAVGLTLCLRRRPRRRQGSC